MNPVGIQKTTIAYELYFSQDAAYVKLWKTIDPKKTEKYSKAFKIYQQQLRIFSDN